MQMNPAGADPVTRDITATYRLAPLFNIRPSWLVIAPALAFVIMLVFRLARGYSTSTAVDEAMFGAGVAGLTIAGFAAIQHVGIQAWHRISTQLEVREHSIEASRRAGMVAARGNRDVLAVLRDEWPAVPPSLVLALGHVGWALLAAGIYMGVLGLTHVVAPGLWGLADSSGGGLFYLRFAILAGTWGTLVMHSTLIWRRLALSVTERRVKQARYLLGGDRATDGGAS